MGFNLQIEMTPTENSLILIPCALIACRTGTASTYRAMIRCFLRMEVIDGPDVDHLMERLRQIFLCAGRDTL